MARLIQTWRELSVPVRIALGAGVGAALVGAIVIGYLVLKRPADVHNPEAAFEPKQEVKKKQREETTNWPLYGLNRARTRYLAAGVKPPFRQKWAFDAGQLLEFSPILVGRTLYVMNNDAKVFALNSETGNVKWKREIGKLSASAPAFAHDRLFLTTLEPGQAVAMNAKTGKVLWRRGLPGRSESQPLVEGGRVYFGDESGNVWGLDEKTGKVAWQTPTAGNVKAGPAFHDGTLYVGDYAGEMYALRASDGAVRWRASDLGAGFGRSGRFYSTPAVAFGRVYAGNADGRVYSFEERTGDLAWSASLNGYVYAAPAVANTPGTPPRVYVGTNGGSVYALSAEDGGEAWSVDMGGEISGAGSIVGRIFYVANVDLEKTVGFDVKSGKPVYNIDRGAYTPVISDSRWIYLTGYASVSALEPKDRKKGATGAGKGSKKPKGSKKSKRSGERDRQGG